MTTKKPALKPVLICTQHRGVFFGLLPQKTDLTARTMTNIKNCRMAIYWGTTNGVMELADTGPTDKSKIGSAADVDVLHDVTSVFSVTTQAAEKWMSA